MKGIEIIIDEKGNTKLKFQGFKGSECFKQADELYALFKQSGINVVGKEETPSRKQIMKEIQSVKKGKKWMRN